MMRNLPPPEVASFMASLHSDLIAQQSSTVRSLIAPALATSVDVASSFVMTLASTTTAPSFPSGFSVTDGEPIASLDDGSTNASSTLSSSTTTADAITTTTSAGSRTSSTSANYTTHAFSTTLQKSVISSSSATTSTSASLPTILGSPECEDITACATETKEAEDHRGAIAGGVVGAVACILLILGAYSFWKSRRRRLQEQKIEEEALWSEKNRPASDLSSSSVTVTELGNEEGKSDSQSESPVELADTDVNQSRTWVISARKDSARFSTDECRGRSASSKEITSGSTSTWLNTAVTGYTSWANEQKVHSPEIGIAVSRYSTAEIFTSPVLSRASSPAKVAQVVVPLQPQLSIHSQRESASTPQLVNRSSSISAQSEAQTIFVGKAKTARRHSLTPRIVNIVASSPTNVAENLVSGYKNILKHHDLPENKRVSVRARSSSATKPSQLYTGSPVKLSNHFGINAWNTSNEPGRTSSDTLKRANSTRADEATRGRTRERDEHVSYPPTSYPALGRTMSEVKRTIRERKGDAFVSTSPRSRPGVDIEPELPSSVTVARGGKGSPRKVRGRGRAGTTHS